MNEMPKVLVCALADAPREVPGSIFTHTCELCGRGLMIAPSGQRLLQKFGVMQLLCGTCFTLTAGPGDRVQLAGTKDEMTKEVLDSKPNLRRGRN